MAYTEWKPLGGAVKLYHTAITSNANFTYKISDFPGYQSLTTANMRVMFGNVWCHLTQSLNGINMSLGVKSYDAATGTVTCTASIKNGNNTVEYNGNSSTMAHGIYLIVASGGFEQ